MGFIQNQNLTGGFSQPEVAYWESAAQPSSAVNNAIIVLGVLTFALQLCLALLFMLRCWSFDRRVQDVLRSQESAKTFSAPDTYKQPPCWLLPEAAAAEEEPSQHSSDPLRAPFLHWDLVQ